MKFRQYLTESSRSTKYDDMPYDPKRQKKNDDFVLRMIKAIIKDPTKFGPRVSIDKSGSSSYISGVEKRTLEKEFRFDVDKFVKNEWQFMSKASIDKRVGGKIVSLFHDRNIRD